jgi:hypothetical protein
MSNNNSARLLKIGLKNSRWAHDRADTLDYPSTKQIAPAYEEPVVSGTVFSQFPEAHRTEVVSARQDVVDLDNTSSSDFTKSLTRPSKSSALMKSIWAPKVCQGKFTFR